MNQIFMNRIHNLSRRLIPVLAAVITAIAAVSCGSRAATQEQTATRLQDAAAAIADGDCVQAQSICDGLYGIMTGADSASVGETQAAMLGILYMKLAEQPQCDETADIACATQCLRRAMRLSPDSLKAFSASLPLDDQRHFVLLRRIGISIDNPVDLTSRDIAEEDYPADSIN